MLLRKINIIGEAHYHVFDGEFVPCTREEYSALSNSRGPTRPFQNWECSCASPLFDTPSGRMEDGTYADDGDRMVKVAGKEMFRVAPALIVFNILPDTLIPKI